jgi:hypothetical protein
MIIIYLLIIGLMMSTLAVLFLRTVIHARVSQDYQTKLTDAVILALGIFIVIVANGLNVRYEKIVFFVCEIIIFVGLSEIYQFTNRRMPQINARKFLGPAKGGLAVLLCSIPFGFSEFTYVIRSDWFVTGSVFSDYYFKIVLLLIMVLMLCGERKCFRSLWFSKIGLVGVFISLLETLVYQVFNLNFHLMSSIGLGLALTGVFSLITGIFIHEITEWPKRR